ncbi:MAG: hypothetical protein ACKPKO_53965, partial [Candidatus Fonsibacter sp.]
SQTMESGSRDPHMDLGTTLINPMQWPLVRVPVQTVRDGLPRMPEEVVRQLIVHARPIVAGGRHTDSYINVHTPTGREVLFMTSGPDGIGQAAAKVHELLSQ